MGKVVLIGLALLYVISPIDFFPEIIFGPFGYIDDLLVFLGALKAASSESGSATTTKIIEQAAPTPSHAGGQDVQQPRLPSTPATQPTALPRARRVLSASDVAKTASLAALVPFGATLNAEQRQLIASAVEGEVFKALKG